MEKKRYNKKYQKKRGRKLRGKSRISGREFKPINVELALERISQLKDTVDALGMTDFVEAIQTIKLVEGNQPIFVQEKGVPPKIVGRDGRAMKFDLWVKHAKVPNAVNFAKSLMAMSHMLNGRFLTKAFASAGFAANPSDIIDVMTILMTDRMIDTKDFDEVFDKVYPFNQVGWVEDVAWKQDCIDGFYMMEDRQVGSSYPTKGERTEEDAEDWFQTSVPNRLLVKTWTGPVKANGKEYEVHFSVEKMALLPDSDGRTKYHIGNRTKGDQPARTQFMKLHGFKNEPLKHIRGAFGNTNEEAFAKISKSLKIKLSTLSKKQLNKERAVHGDAAITAMLKDLEDGKTIIL